MEYVIYTVITLSYLLPLLVGFVLGIWSCIVDKNNGYNCCRTEVFLYFILLLVPALNSHMAIEMLKEYRD